MGNLVSFMHMSLDGFVAGLNGEMDWIHIDEGIFDYIAERIGATDCALYGRKTFHTKSPNLSKVQIKKY